MALCVQKTWYNSSVELCENVILMGGVFVLEDKMRNKVSDIHVNIKVDNLQETCDLIQSIKTGLNEIADDICRLYELIKSRES